MWSSSLFWVTCKPAPNWLLDLNSWPIQFILFMGPEFCIKGKKLSWLFLPYILQWTYNKIKTLSHDLWSLVFSNSFFISNHTSWLCPHCCQRCSHSCMYMPGVYMFVCLCLWLLPSSFNCPPTCHLHTSCFLYEMLFLFSPSTLPSGLISNGLSIDLS